MGRHRQKAYALLLMLVVLMGLGGVVATEFTQDARTKSEQQRFLHNQRVLKQAKDALLLYAYNYTFNNAGRGPGRMPCPDMDNDGIPETPLNCINGTPLVGRFPWNDPDMNLYDIRDASGQRLWYAVSRNFASQKPFGTDVINAGTTGSITIHDQSGELLHDNTDDGIAAVIIAPGAPVDRNGTWQDRSIGNGDNPDDTTADTDAGIINADRYLDVFGLRDNVNFDNTAGSADGFILGPVRDANGDIIVNDQMILITAEEVTQMAQRAVLESYRQTIDAWQATVWANPANYRYPWLNDYDNISALDTYRVIPGLGNTDTVGRLPFMNYFIDLDTHELITDLSITFNIDFDLSDTGPDGGTYLAEFDNEWAGEVLTIQNAKLSFDSGGSTTDNSAIMVVESDAVVPAFVTSTNPVVTRLYFWDGCAGCDFTVQDGWQLCNPPAATEQDCAMSNVGPFVDSPPYNWVPFTSWNNHADIRIRYVELQLEFDPEFQIVFNPSQPKVENAPTSPDNANNATRRYEVDQQLTGIGVALDGAGPGSSARFVNITKQACEQDNYVGNGYDIPSNGGGLPDSIDCLAGLTLNYSPPPTLATQFEVTTDYYPEMPEWVRENRWNDSILMAYDNDLRPGTAASACNTTAPNCLTVNLNYNGSTTTTSALLVGANAQPANAADLLNIFEGENNVPDEDVGGGGPVDTIFEAHPIGGDDTMHIVQ